MVKNKQSFRSLTAFLVTWSFAVLTLTGLVLYVVPQGRVAYWVHWSLLGMEKEQWAWVHMMFGGVFIVTGILHLYFNWKPFKKYFAERSQGIFQIKQEVVVSLLLTAAIFSLSVFNLPPASWVFDLNRTIKDSWVTHPDLEPPFGHAEEVSLAGMAKRMDLELEPALAALKEAGIRFDSQRDSLEKIARANGITPMAIYAVIRRFERQPAPLPKAGLTAEAVEARFSGTGLGRKSLQELIGKTGVPEAIALDRLRTAGMADPSAGNVRELADRHGLSPIDIVKIIMLPDHKVPDAP